VIWYCAYPYFILIFLAMTMSPDQAMEASVFLTIYREAIEGLEYPSDHTDNLLCEMLLTKSLRNSLTKLSSLQAVASF
jgi:hypothetical protein